MLGLARIFRIKGDLDSCRTQCAKVLLAFPGEAEASIMLSDAIFHSTSASADTAAAFAPDVDHKDSTDTDDAPRAQNSQKTDSAAADPKADPAAAPLESLLRLYPANLKVCL